MEIVGHHVRSMNRLNVAITNIYPTKSAIGVGIQRLDGSPDGQFAKFHQSEMTGTDLLQLVPNVETLEWDLPPSTGLEYMCQADSGDYRIELFSVMRQEEAITCFLKILAGTDH